MELYKEYPEKAEFVDKFIKPLLRELDECITDVRYVCENGNERVLIEYRLGTREVYVNYDSNLAITKDVIRHLLIEDDAEWVRQ